MENIINEIRKSYLVDGETGRYATLFNSKEEVSEEMDTEIFEEKYGVSVDEVSYPIITFDNANATDGMFFEAGMDKFYILEQAEQYFDRK